jgi:transcriptional regulator with XRE-family HTH domain
MLACAILLNRIISATTWQVLMSRQQSFASTLRWWRQHRGLSQLDLAGRAEISQRHLSFMELGRASPSPEMVMRLAAALDVPLRQHNTLLLAAGFAPVWRQTDLAAPELSQVRSALDYMMAQQEPFPAVAVDRHWNLLRSNSGAVRLVEFLVGPLAPDTPINLADALVAPDSLRPFLLNWANVVRYFIRSVEADAAADGTPEQRLFSKGCSPMRGCGRPSKPRQPNWQLPRFFPCTSAKATPRCDCSRPSRRWAPLRTSRYKSFASNVFSDG